MSAMEQFYAAAERLRILTSMELYGSPVGAARRMPGDWRSMADQLSITTRNENKAAVEAAEVIRKRVADDFEARGHEKRRAALDEIAREIDKLRATLPDLAADAAVEMGTIARQVRAEASQ